MRQEKRAPSAGGGWADDGGGSGPGRMIRSRGFLGTSGCCLLVRLAMLWCTHIVILFTCLFNADLAQIRGLGLYARYKTPVRGRRPLVFAPWS